MGIMDMETLYPYTDYKALCTELMNGFYDAVMITDPNGYILEVNDKTLQMFRYEPEEFQDLPISALIPERERTVLQRVKREVERKGTLLLEVRCLRRDGTTFQSEISISKIAVARRSGLLMTIRDIDRRRYQWSHLRSKANAFDLAQTPSFCCNRNGSLKSANAAFRELFDIRPDGEITSFKFCRLLPDPSLQLLFGRALEGEKGTGRFSLGEEGGEQSARYGIRLGPDCQGKREIVGVVGSICRLS